KILKMALSIINSFASWILKKRIHQIELFMKYPNEVQEELLFNLLRNAEYTVLGKQYGFSSIKSYAAFAEAVPVVTYEELQPYIERARKGEPNIFWNTPIKWFAKSSGTTDAKSKFIPVSNEALEDCHFKAGKDMHCLYLNNNEKTRKGEPNIFWNTPIKWFAKSSGTTDAKSKFIPVSNEALEDCHFKAGKDMLCLYLNNNENSELFTGKSLRLGGSKQLYED